MLLPVIFAERILRMEKMPIVLQRAKSTIPFQASSRRRRPYSSTKNAGEKSLYKGKRARPNSHVPKRKSRPVDDTPNLSSQSSYLVSFP